MFGTVGATLALWVMNSGRLLPSYIVPPLLNNGGFKQWVVAFPALLIWESENRPKTPG